MRISASIVAGLVIGAASFAAYASRVAMATSKR